MGKKTFFTSIICGAITGGLISLINPQVREYVKTAADDTRKNLTAFTENPEVAVNKAKDTVQSVNEFVATNSNSALNAIDQVGNSVTKFLKK